MRLNKPNDPRRNRTHEGGKAFSNLTPIQQLRRSVMSCLLFEDEFYEDGVSISDRIESTASKVDPEKLAEIAIEARHKYHLRHAPLLLLTVLTRIGSGREDGLVRKTIEEVITRADEMPEFLSMYWRNGKTPLSGQVKKGLAAAFKKFDAYQLAKYNRDYAIKLRDVLFMVHPKPTDELETIWTKLADNELESPDTWEVELSSGKEKGKTFERLIREKKLGYLALLRNLRNMIQGGTDLDLVKKALLEGNASRVLLFRFVAAARACPQLEPTLDKALQKKIKEEEPLKGETIVLVDVSWSMSERLSGKSDLSRMDAAATLASVINSEHLRVFTFSDRVVEVPPRRGMAGIDAVITSQSHSGTRLGQAVREMNAIKHDRLIVITDEQSQDNVGDARANNAYMINVASNQNGVGYGKWIHIDGFSERVINYIKELESWG